jgi:PAS domain-containing protein
MVDPRHSRFTSDDHNGVMSDRDGIDHARLSALVAGQNKALELALSGKPLGEVLKVLVLTAEAQSEGSFMGSILLLDEDGKHLRHGAAPSLPDAYNQAIDGVKIGPSVGSCGTAAYLGHSIFVTDIARDPLWANFADLALGHGLRACWSTPFVSREGAVLGTLALYYREPRGPTEHDREIVKLIGATAAVIIENARLSERLRDLHRRAQLAADAGGLGFFTWEIGPDIVSWQNERPYEMFGVERAEGPISARRFVSEFLHPEDQPAFASAVRLAVENGTSFQFECRVRRKGDGELRWISFTGQLDTEARDRGVSRVVGIAADVTQRKRDAA